MERSGCGNELSERVPLSARSTVHMTKRRYLRASRCGVSANTERS